MMRCFAIISLSEYAMDPALVNLVDHAPQLMTMVTSVLTEDNEEARQDLVPHAVKVLVNLARRIGPAFTPFEPLVDNALGSNGTPCPEFELLRSSGFPFEPLQCNKVTQQDFSEELKKKMHYTPNISTLRESWDTTRVSTEQDWLGWLQRLEIEVLHESPSASLRACSPLRHFNLGASGTQLFHSGFQSVWKACSQEHQSELAGHLEKALTASAAPVQVKQTLLSLDEFMERNGCSLPLGTSALAEAAIACHAYAKALRYKENEFLLDPNAQNVEALICIHGNLNKHSEAALGVLLHAKRNLNVIIEKSWHEELGQWDEAADGYRETLETNPYDLEAAMGLMRCLQAISEWEELDTLAESLMGAQRVRDTLTSDHALREELSSLAADAALKLGQWDKLDHFSTHMPPQTLERELYTAILAVKNNIGVPEAQSHIARARELLDPRLSALIGESYDRAYPMAINAQILVELEEILQFKGRHKGADMQQDLMKDMWSARLNGVQRSAQVWERLLSVRRLAVEPIDDEETWVKFSGLCRKSGRTQIATRTLAPLMGEQASPRVRYAHCKILWVNKEKEEAIDALRVLTSELGADDDPEMLARCLACTGRWVWEIRKPQDGSASAVGEDSLTPYPKGFSGKAAAAVASLAYFEAAMKVNPDYYKAWHSWGWMHYQLEAESVESEAGVMESSSDSPAPPGHDAPDEDWLEWIQTRVEEYDDETLREFDLSREDSRERALSTAKSLAANNEGKMFHVKAAMRGFFKCIELEANSAGGNKRSLKDILRLLTLWFRHGDLDEVGPTLQEGFNACPVDTWLQVMHTTYILHTTYIHIHIHM